MRIVDLLERDAVLYRDKTAVTVVGGPSLTFGELHRRVTGLAAGLAGRGVRRGDRIALRAANGLAFFDAYLAAAYLGAAVVPIGTRLAGPEVDHILDDAEPVVCIADEAHADGLPDPLVDYEALCRTEVPAGIAELAHESDTALLVYTSGTTGRPKGVCLSQRALTFNAVTIALAQALTPDDVFLTTTPLYHVATGTRVTTMLLDGQTHVVLPEFDVADCLRAIDEHGVTTTVAVPTQLRRILDSPALGDARLDSLRLLVYGAAPSALPLVRQAVATLPCGFYQGYGLTEACTNLTGLVPSDHVGASDERLLSCGRAVPGVTIRIEPTEGDIGEILVRSEKLMSGYWRNPVATRDAVVDGWLRTGDLGRIDADGYVTIVDRAKDMLISGGVNVYPSEIEAVLQAHPAVAEVAVVGQPDEEWGEVPAAFVQLRDGQSTTAEELQAWCRTQLAGLKVPRSVMLVEDFPRTASGKIRKVDLQPARP